MAKYIPRVEEVIFIDGRGLVRYLVTGVDPSKKTADVKNVSGVIGLTRNVPWSALHRLDESQNAIRIVQKLQRAGSYSSSGRRSRKASECSY